MKQTIPHPSGNLIGWRNRKLALGFKKHWELKRKCWVPSRMARCSDITELLPDPYSGETDTQTMKEPTFPSFSCELSATLLIIHV